MTNPNRNVANPEALDQLLARLDQEILRQSKILLGLLAKRATFRFLRDVAMRVIAAGSTEAA